MIIKCKFLQENFTHYFLFNIIQKENIYEVVIEDVKPWLIIGMTISKLSFWWRFLWVRRTTNERWILSRPHYADNCQFSLQFPSMSFGLNCLFGNTSVLPFPIKIIYLVCEVYKEVLKISCYSFKIKWI